MVHMLMISAEFSPHPRPTMRTRASILAKIFAHQGHKVVILSNAGRIAEGSPVSSLLRNLVPAKSEVDHVTWIFPPVIRTGLGRGPLKAVEGLLSIMSTLIFGFIFLLPHREKVEIIYASTAQAQGYIGACLKAIMKRPLAVNYGDPAFARDKGVVRAFGKLLETVTFRKSDMVFALDPVIAEYVMTEFGKRAVFLPSAHDPDLFHESARPPSLSREKIITFVGKVDLSVYRLDILLDALSLLIGKFPNVRLRIIGDGPSMGYLKSHAARLGVHEFVLFIGVVPHEEVPRWLSESDICVDVTNDMCTGLKVAEYMATRKPIVVAAPWWNRYDQYLENGVNCVMVPLDAQELANALLDLLESPSIADRLATNGFKTALNWTWENIARKKMTLIAELTK